MTAECYWTGAVAAQMGQADLGLNRCIQLSTRQPDSQRDRRVPCSNSFCVTPKVDRNNSNFFFSSDSHLPMLATCTNRHIEHLSAAHPTRACIQATHTSGCSSSSSAPATPAFDSLPFDGCLFNPRDVQGIDNPCEIGAWLCAVRLRVSPLASLTIPVDTNLINSSCQAHLHSQVCLRSDRAAVS